jgi:hypothetical protein
MAFLRAYSNNIKLILLEEIHLKFDKSYIDKGEGKKV